MNPPAAHQDVDPALLRQIAAGDTAAFERFYSATSGLLYSLAFRMLGRPEDAEELLQEIYVKIWREAASYDPRRGAPLAWAVTMTRHKAIDKIRSTTRRLNLNERAEREAEITSPNPLAQPGQEAVAAENATAVQASLQTLPADVRETIDLAYFGGLSHTEIAAKLSLPLTTVKSRIRRAMMQLRQTLRHHA